MTAPGYDVGMAFVIPSLGVAAVAVAPATRRRLRRAGVVCWLGGWLAGLAIYFGIRSR